MYIFHQFSRGNLAHSPTSDVTERVTSDIGITTHKMEKTGCNPDKEMKGKFAFQSALTGFAF